MRRISSSSLRFPLVTYVYVRSQQGSRDFLVLLVSLRFLKKYILRIFALQLRAFWSRTLSTLPARYSLRLKLLASPPFLKRIYTSHFCIAALRGFTILHSFAVQKGQEILFNAQNSLYKSLQIRYNKYN